MTGHQPILDLRRRRLCPTFVWINERPTFIADETTVYLEENETPELQDWRFLIGVTAIVEGESSDRIARIAACIKPIAKRVIENYIDPTRPAAFKYDLIRIIDSEGHLSWPK